ncbi:MAG: amidohydrolase family protein [Candidatus Pacebacteria bacterium]|nr:amidohydrolase family protein [Candidatus Paceibacterota bacterium]PIR61101.1 MAG: hypothetical protein COU68_01265 [Candidatus Pacebacteria bacterium CG10_big_fil_rev_8_21_14_0_10_45_6]
MPANHFTFKPLILAAIQKNGGWVNAHAHVDRAFTINPDSLGMYSNHTLEEKWDLVDAVKKDASETEYYDRFCRAFEVMISNGVNAIGSFVDVDPVCKDRAIKGGLRAREKFKNELSIRFATQTLKGVINKEARYWFDRGAELVDIIGGLPKRDERDFGPGFGAKHMDILLQTAKRQNKLVHVHVDQFNTPMDVETELLCNKTVEHGMQNKVVAIHAISLAAHKKSYRLKIYKKLKAAGIMMIACPMAWIDSPRREDVAPIHNSLTPVDELVSAGITVAIGTDNICDFMVPFCDGDMWQELSVLAAGTRFTNIDELVKIATINGRKVLGL